MLVFTREVGGGKVRWEGTACSLPLGVHLPAVLKSAMFSSQHVAPGTPVLVGPAGGYGLKLWSCQIQQEAGS